jgi:chemotaxis protein CheD
VALTRQPNAQSTPAQPLRGFEAIKRYWDNDNGKFAAKILPGEFYVTTHDEVITTVLGSCIAACIRDPVFGIGGMNHFMLPISDGGAWGGDLDHATRFGNFAMEHMINEILKNGGSRHNLEVKIFGGGRVLANMTNVGQRNIDFIKEYLRVEGLTLLAEDVGDVFPRKVQYLPLSGRARVKKLRANHSQAVAERERNYLHDMDAQPQTGDIDLF